MLNNLLTMANYIDAFHASVDKNPDLCLSIPCNREKKREFVKPVVASSIAAVLVLLLIFCALVMCRRKIRGSTLFIALSID